MKIYDQFGRLQIVNPRTLLPIGTVLMFNGAGWTDDSTIPGFYKCDGNNGTPNLVNKFIRSEASSGNTGGSDDAIVVTHTHVIGSSGSHNHRSYIHEFSGGAGYISLSSTYNPSYTTLITPNTPENGSHTHTPNNSGSSGTGANKPAYYSLIFVMRVK